MNAATEYYLTGTRSGLSASEARSLVTQHHPAIARPQDRADFIVYYLDTKPRQHGQQPFVLQPHELP